MFPLEKDGEFAFVAMRKRILNSTDTNHPTQNQTNHMKTKLVTFLSSLALSVAAFGHGEIEIGPSGGRILEFSKNETMHGEVTEKGGKLHIEVLDKDMKPVALTGQELTATTGDRAKPEKVAVAKEGKYFVIPEPKAGEWVIFQFKENAKAKAITARLEYDTKKCGECDNPEWLCKCPAAKDAKKK